MITLGVGKGGKPFASCRRLGDFLRSHALLPARVPLSRPTTDLISARLANSGVAPALRDHTRRPLRPRPLARRFQGGGRLVGHGVEPRGLSGAGAQRSPGVGTGQDSNLRLRRTGVFCLSTTQPNYVHRRMPGAARQPASHGARRGGRSGIGVPHPGQCRCCGCPGGLRSELELMECLFPARLLQLRDQVVGNQPSGNVDS